MVSLTKIYTRGGDTGQTSLIGGTRVAKHHARMEAIGAVDECNAVLGLARLHCEGEEDAMLARIQHDLFDLGADVATPLAQGAADAAAEDGALRMVAAQVARLEQEIDAMNSQLQPLSSFVLPGGTAAAAYLHLARVVARRAERTMTALAESEAMNPQAMCYINRLSDHFFVLSRRLNGNGAQDILWQPGVNR